MAPPDEPIEATVDFPNGRIKYSGSRLHGEMHGAWDGNVVKETPFGD